VNPTGTTYHGDTTTTPEQRRAAALYVCAHATSTEDARKLLDALGIREGL
jgi:hypothetical protein